MQAWSVVFVCMYVCMYVRMYVWLCMYVTMYADIDECQVEESNNCNVHATCVNTVGAFNCTCKDGFTGNGTACTDIDECTVADDNDCHVHATCANSVGSFTCTCKDGFAGNGRTCIDIDECKLEHDNDCHANATCANTVGSFKCTCKDGYFGTGIRCNVIVSGDATVPEGKFVVKKTIMVTENVVRDVVQAEQGVPIDLTLPKYADDKKNYEVSFKTKSGAGDGTTVSYTSVPASTDRRRLSKEGSSKAAWALVLKDGATLSATKALVSSQAFSDSVAKSAGVTVAAATASIATIEVALTVEKDVFVLFDHIECKDGFKGAGSECMDKCKCDHGTAATGAACTTHDASICASCDKGFRPNADNTACLGNWSRSLCEGFVFVVCKL